MLFLGDCLEVFFSNLLVYYTRLPSVLARVIYFFISVLEIIVILKNFKTIPNQMLSKKAQH